MSDILLEEVRLAREILKKEADNLAKLRAYLERGSDETVPATSTSSAEPSKVISDK